MNDINSSILFIKYLIKNIFYNILYFNVMEMIMMIMMMSTPSRNKEILIFLYLLLFV